MLYVHVHDLYSFLSSLLENITTFFKFQIRECVYIELYIFSKFCSLGQILIYLLSLSQIRISENESHPPPPPQPILLPRFMHTSSIHSDVELFTQSVLGLQNCIFVYTCMYFKNARIYTFLAYLKIEVLRSKVTVQR